MTSKEGPVGWSSPGAIVRPISRDPFFRYELVPGLATLVLAAVEVWAASFPGGSFDLAVLAFVLGLPVTFLWLLLIVDRVLWRRVIGWARILFLLVSLPAVVAATALVLDADIPLRARLALSEPALAALATSGPRTGIVGLYEVQDFSRTEFGFEFRTSSALFGECGLAYSPDVVPDSALQPRGYEHVDGPWYMWCDKFD